MCDLRESAVNKQVLNLQIEKCEVIYHRAAAFPSLRDTT
jgi:hypothetical protein